MSADLRSVSCPHVPVPTQGRGAVYFVGAGPGDPELLTLKAQRLIAAADVIIYAGSLINPAVLDYARPDAALHNSAGMRLDDQVVLMRDAVARGETVVRLHTGDPAVFGATLEQMCGLERFDITYHVVPGVSSAFAAAAALGIELTVPGDTQTVILTRLAGKTPVPPRETLRDLAAHHASLVIFLSAGMLERVVDELSCAGYSPDTPIAMVFRASWPDQWVVRGTLADIVDRVQSAEITHQALIIVSPALSPNVRTCGAATSHLYSTALEAPQRRPATAIVTLTRAGTGLGARLHRLLPGSILYAPARHGPGPDENTVPYITSVRQVLQAAFKQHTSLVCIMASGIVVRELSPLLTSKHSDPGVVVVDEQGHYAVSLLAGHKGGANEMARQVAGLLGGQAVLTTASDVQGLPALDLLGHQRGWALQRGERMAAIGAALVNGEAVGIVQECGDAGWLPEPLPTNLERYATLAELQAATPAAAVIVTYRRVPEQVQRAVPDSIIYNPPVLVPGVGCNRGTPVGEILSAIDETLAEAGLEVRSVGRVATIADKADEPGLVEACAARGWPLKVFTRQEIIAQAGVLSPSPWAQRVLGVPGVAEPAALLGAGTDRLLVKKRKFPNTTVAVALRREDAS